MAVTGFLLTPFYHMSDEKRASDTSPSVLILYRYNHLFQERFDDLKKMFSGLRLYFSTVHKAKGLEADYVVVLSVVSGKYAFPSDVADDPSFDLFLAEKERFHYAEERRLFYVALTRSKNKVYLLTGRTRQSEFIYELCRDEYKGLVELK